MPNIFGQKSGNNLDCILAPLEISLSVFSCLLISADKDWFSIAIANVSIKKETVLSSRKEFWLDDGSLKT